MGEKVIVESDYDAIHRNPSSLGQGSLIHRGGVYDFKQHGRHGHDLGSSCLTVPPLLELQSQLAQGTFQVADFTRKLLDIYSQSYNGGAISRVCLTHNPVFSRKLSIVSSANFDSRGLEDLVPGYSCYVAPSSSLFPRGNGNVNGVVRTYSDIENIVQSFKSSRKPTQRTIRKLYDAGIQSGLSLSLDFGIQGGCVLFLNSHEPSAFDNWNVNDPLSITVLRMVVYSAFRNFLDIGCDSPMPQEIVIDKNGISSVLSPQQFAMSLEREIEQNLGLRLRVDYTNHLEQRFFVPTQTVLFIVTAILKNSDRLCSDSLFELNVSLRSIKDDSSILIEVRGGLEVKSSALFRSIGRIAKRSEIEIIKSESGFDLSVPCVLANQQESLHDYSTA
jgi:hypothetical protein